MWVMLLMLALMVGCASHTVPGAMPAQPKAPESPVSAFCAGLAEPEQSTYAYHGTAGETGCPRNGRR